MLYIQPRTLNTFLSLFPSLKISKNKIWSGLSTKQLSDKISIYFLSAKIEDLYSPWSDLLDISLGSFESKLVFVLDALRISILIHLI